MKKQRVSDFLTEGPPHLHFSSTPNSKHTRQRAMCRVGNALRHAQIMTGTSPLPALRHVRLLHQVPVTATALLRVAAAASCAIIGVPSPYPPLAPAPPPFSALCPIRFVSLRSGKVPCRVDSGLPAAVIATSSAECLRVPSAILCEC